MNRVEPFLSRDFERLDLFLSFRSTSVALWKYRVCQVTFGGRYYRNPERIAELICRRAQVNPALVKGAPGRQCFEGDRFEIPGVLVTGSTVHRLETFDLQADPKRLEPLSGLHLSRQARKIGRLSNHPEALFPQVPLRT